jgi:Ca2+:H+ antiporter
MDRHRVLHRVPFLVPPVGLVLLGLVWGRSLPTIAALAVALVQIAIVAIAVIHAEEIAHRVGEPFGTLVLAVAVTVIEVALIVTLMVTEGPKSASLARDTVFAAVMIVCNGIVGVALLLSARRAGVVRFSEQGACALLGTVMTLAGLSLVMPRFTVSSAGPTFSGSQLAFAAVSSATVYGIFVFVETGRHRWMFLSPDEGDVGVTNPGDDEHGGDVAATSLIPRFAALVVSLAVVVGLAKTLSKPIERGVDWLGAPQSFIGVVIALMVLMPESVAAFRAASRGEMQTSLNLALGSALASIGLTIPAIAVASIWLDGPINLGLGGKEIVLLVLTAIVSILTFGSGSATVLQATHHLALFAAFIFLAIVP